MSERSNSELRPAPKNKIIRYPPLTELNILAETLMWVVKKDVVCLPQRLLGLQCQDF